MFGCLDQKNEDGVGGCFQCPVLRLQPWLALAVGGPDCGWPWLWVALAVFDYGVKDGHCQMGHSLYAGLPDENW